MSVIIRLQNLPWSANAMDIRTFFRGLSIPEGGVHIVGGEQGDAFIAFSTDEDARQAMMNDGGKIKEVQVKLLLSSRSEMHKVIEAARQNVSFLQLSQSIVPPVQQTPTLPPSISGLLAQNMKPLSLNLAAFPIQQNEAMVTPVETVQINDSDKDKDLKRNNKNDRRAGRSRSKSRERDRKDRSRDRDRKDKRDRSRSRDRSRDRDRRRRERSRSRDRRDRGDRKRDRKDRSRERDRKEISDPRLQRKDDKKNVNDDNKAYNMNFNNKSKDSLLGEFPHVGDRSEQSKIMQPMVGMGGPRLPFMNAALNMNRNWPADMAMMNNQVQPGEIRMNNFDAIFPNRFGDVNIDHQMQRLQELDEKRNPNAFQKTEVMSYAPRNMGPRGNFNDGNYGGGIRMPPPNYREGLNNHDSRSRFNHNSTGKSFCVKLTNLSTSTGYGDIRRFFSGIFISSQGLKIINNDNGKRSGTALVKFYKSEGKHTALSKNGELLKGRPVLIAHLDDEEFENAIDSYRPNKDSDDSGDEGDSQNSLVIIDKNENEDNESFKVLILEDLPAFAKEHDIMKMFSDYSLLSIFIIVTKDVRKQYIAYVQFVNAEDAKAALNNKSKHLIGHKVIKVSPCSESAFEAAKASQNNLDENSERTDIDMQNRKDFQGEEQSMPRDPRQRRFENRQDDGSYKQMKPYHNSPNQNNPRFQWRGSMNPYSNHGPDREHHSMMRRPMGNQNDYNKPFVDPQRLDCIIIKGLPTRTNDRDILDFFSDIGIIPAKTHLMLNLQGQPSGDCFCEFLNPEEAVNAVAKNGSVLGGNTITVELVSKQMVEEALGIPPTEKNFNTRGGYRGGRGFIHRGHPRRMRGGPAPYHAGSRGGGNRFMNPEHSYNSSSEDTCSEGFGVPGCILSLENVPFRATIEEILDFFGDFELSPNNVIRRFSDKGTPTGDVRVNLQSQAEAQRACQQLNKQYIRDRCISISQM